MLNTKLFEAAQGSRITEMQQCLAKGAEVNAKNGFFKETTLHMAARESHIGAIQYLLENKVTLMLAVALSVRTCI